MIKKLSRSGNSLALVIDRPLLEQLQIDGDTECKLPLPFPTYESETVEERERRVARYRERKAGIAAAGRKLAAEIAAKASTRSR